MYSVMLAAEYCKCVKDADKFAGTNQRQCNCAVSTKASSMTKLSKDVQYKANFFNYSNSISATVGHLRKSQMAQVFPF